MATLTGKQAKKILEIFEDTPSEQIQRMLASGLLADLRDANFYQEINREDFRRLCGFKQAPVFSRDMRKEGWTLLENTPCRITAVKDFEPIPFLKKGESSINGEEMVRRARQEFNANLGHEDAEWILEHQDQIPEEWRKYYLIFPRTVWQDSGGYRRVAYLVFAAGRWCLYFHWLNSAWGDHVRPLSACKFTCR